jgi:hypothetical protein
MRIVQFSLLSVFLILSCAFTQIARGGQDSGVDDLYNFIKQNLIGKRLEMRKTALIDSGKVEAEFERTKMFADLARTANGLIFDVVSIIHQKNFDLDEHKKRLDKRPQTVDRVIVVHYEIKASRSTGELLGFTHIIVNTLLDSTGDANSIRVVLSNNRLTFLSNQALYGDYFAASGKYSPGRAEITDEYWSDNHKLRGKLTEKDTRVDPKSLAPEGESIVNVGEEVEP